MNKKLYALCLFIICLSANYCLAQQDTIATNRKGIPSYALGKTVSLVLGGGIAAPAHYGGIWLEQSAPVFFIEPQFQLSRKIDFGVRFEYALLTTYRATYISDQLASIKGSKMPSVALTLDYRLGAAGKSIYQPNNSLFIGMGVGMFFRGDGQLLARNNEVYPLGNCPGVIPRFGFTSRRIVIVGEYNLLWENETHGVFRSWLGTSGEFRGRSYASLKLGIKI